MKILYCINNYTIANISLLWIFTDSSEEVVLDFFYPFFVHNLIWIPRSGYQMTRVERDIWNLNWIPKMLQFCLLNTSISDNNFERFIFENLLVIPHGWSRYYIAMQLSIIIHSGMKFYILFGAYAQWRDCEEGRWCYYGYCVGSIKRIRNYGIIRNLKRPMFVLGHHYLLNSSIHI